MPATVTGTPSATSIQVSAPTHAPGTVDVTVTNADGQSSTLASAYTYLAPGFAVSTVTFALMNAPGLSAIDTAPSMESLSVMVTKSMPAATCLMTVEAVLNGTASRSRSLAMSRVGLGLLLYRDGDMACSNSKSLLVVEHRQRRVDRLPVHQRLAHSHEDHVRWFSPGEQSEFANLSGYFIGAKISGESHRTGCAERALQSATSLRRYAKRQS